VIAGRRPGPQALRQADIREPVVARWGKEGWTTRERSIAAGWADRLRDEGERKALEALVHPYIRRRDGGGSGRARTDGVALLVVDAAILLEALEQTCAMSWCTSMPRPSAAGSRGGAARLDAEELARRESAQLPLTEKRALADHVLENSADLAHLRRKSMPSCTSGTLPADRTEVTFEDLSDSLNEAATGSSGRGPTP